MQTRFEWDEANNCSNQRKQIDRLMRNIIQQGQSLPD